MLTIQENGSTTRLLDGLHAPSAMAIGLDCFLPPFPPSLSDSEKEWFKGLKKEEWDLFDSIDS